MIINQYDVQSLIKRAEVCLREDDPSYLLLLSYIHDLKEMLPYIKGNLTSAQKEKYDRLEAAIGPGC